MSNDANSKFVKFDFLITYIFLGHRLNVRPYAKSHQSQITPALTGKSSAKAKLLSLTSTFRFGLSNP